MGESGEEGANGAEHFRDATKMMGRCGGRCNKLPRRTLSASPRHAGTAALVWNARLARSCPRMGGGACSARKFRRGPVQRRENRRRPPECTEAACSAGKNRGGRGKNRQNREKWRKTGKNRDFSRAGPGPGSAGRRGAEAIPAAGDGPGPERGRRPGGAAESGPPRASRATRSGRGRSAGAGRGKMGAVLPEEARQGKRRAERPRARALRKMERGRIWAQYSPEGAREPGRRGRRPGGTERGAIIRERARPEPRRAGRRFRRGYKFVSCSDCCARGPLAQRAYLRRS